MEKPRPADDSHRLFIAGQNGSGKTAAGVNWLAWRSYTVKPWYIINYKWDDYLEKIPGVREVGLHEPITQHPGLYMVRPPPEPGSIDDLLARGHKASIHGRPVGWYIDEGINVGEHSRPFRLVLAQGRSLKEPVIFLAQRPVFLGKFPLTEANMFQTFHLQAKVDRQTISEYLPVGVNYHETLREYESYYFDAGKRRLARINPAPYGDEVLDVFDRRRPRRFKGVR